LKRRSTPARKEQTMTDVLIHVHPDLSAEMRAKVEQDVQALGGVISACFAKKEHPHAMMVEYDPDAIKGARILEAVKQYDPAASLVGL
jgi:hypothetical protein